MSANNMATSCRILVSKIRNILPLRYFASWVKSSIFSGEGAKNFHKELNILL